MTGSYTLVVLESPYAPTVPLPEEFCTCPSVCFNLRFSDRCGRCQKFETARWEQLNRNLRYARACMKDCLLRGEAPYASHLLYTQEGVLDDDVPAEREAGIQAGFAWRQVAQKTVVYTDLGVSRGMEYGIADASKRGVPVEFRKLPGWEVEEE